MNLSNSKNARLMREGGWDHGQFLLNMDLCDFLCIIFLLSMNVLFINL